VTADSASAEIPVVDAHNGVNRVSRLCNHNLQIEGRHIPVDKSHSARAVRVNCVCARSRPPANRDVTVYSNCINLGEVPLAVEPGFGDAINQKGPGAAGGNICPWTVKE
jgi:hypothetical protein